MSLQIPEELKPAALDKMMSLLENTILPRIHFGGQEQSSALLVPVGEQVKGIKLQLTEHYPLHLQRVEFYSGHDLRVAEGRISVHASSVYKNDERYAARNTLQENALFFHSKKDKYAWLEFQFEETTKLSHLLIHNANPGYYWRSYSLKVLETGNNRVVYDNYSWCHALERAIRASAHCGAISHSDACQRLARLFAKFYAADKIRTLVAQQSSRDNRIAIMDCANRALNPFGHGVTHHGINRTFLSMSATERVRIIQGLQNFMHALQKRLGISCFITSGTLLGFVRDRALLPHDDDLDICYLSHEKSAAAILQERTRLIATLRQMGYPAKLSASQTHVQAKLTGGINLDLFVAFESNGYIDASPLPRGITPRDQILPLRTIEAYGIKLPVPRNIDLYLANNYGPKWRERDPSWRFDWPRARREYAFLLPA